MVISSSPFKIIDGCLVVNLRAPSNELRCKQVGLDNLMVIEKILKKKTSI